MSIFNYLNESYLHRYDSVINEAYIGKTETLKQIEEKIGELRSSKDCSYYKNISSCKKMQEINRLFEKQFGMDIFALKVVPSNTINAYTVSISLKFDIAEDYREISDFVVGNMDTGFRFKKDNNLAVVVNVYYGLFADSMFTDEEILAVLLHEVGHNFSSSLYNDIYYSNREMVLAYKNYLKGCIILYAILSLFLVGIPFLIKSIKEYRDPDAYNKKSNKKEKKASKRPGSGKIKGFFSGLKGKINDYFAYINELYTRLYFGDYIKDYYKNIDKEYKGHKNEDHFKEAPGRIDEVMADKFAGIYGYGPALISGLMKMSTYQSKAYKKAEEKDADANLNFEKACLDSFRFDVHPQNIQRANEEIKLLKRELAKEDVDPKLKEAMEKQLQEIQDIVDEYSKLSKELSKSEKAKAAFNKLVSEKYPDAVSDEIEEKIEEAFDKCLEESEKKYKDKLKKKK